MICRFEPSYRWIAMEGSTESTRMKSSSSRELNASRVSNLDLRLPQGGGTGLSGVVLNDSSHREGDDNRVSFAHNDYVQNQGGLSGVCEDEVAVDPYVRAIEWGDISLRQWLDKPERSVDVFECLHIFRQIVGIVNVAHSQGIVVNNVRPSCFVMSSFNLVSFIESASCSDSGSDNLEDGSNSPTPEPKTSSTSLPDDDLCTQKRNPGSEDLQPMKASANAFSETSCMQSSSTYAPRESLVVETEENRNKDRRSAEVEEKKQPFPMKHVLLMETNWYTSPEEATGASSSCASDIYRLGVLLFELFCPSSSREEKSRTMSSLRHRVLPAQLLLKWPKEASFCLWLLHPEPTSRPKMGELLQSEFLNEPRDDLEEREAAIELREQIEEQELLLEFLLLIQQRKLEAADKLQNTLSFLCSDIEEVTKQQSILKKKGGSCPDLVKEDNSTSSLPSMNIVINDDSTSLGSRKRFRPGLRNLQLEECDDNIDGEQKSDSEDQDNILLKNSRLMKNFKKLESAYFSTRCRPAKLAGKHVIRQTPISSDGKGSAIVSERSFVNNLTSKDRSYERRQSGWINPFLEGLCKYLSFSKLKVKADLKQGDLLNSSNLVCSLSFDRDGELFATAGVNKKIKVFECNTIINEDRDIHYPVVEIATRSKLSSICWNSYIKSQIASSNFEGVVQLWDVTRSQVQMEMREHERRVWSIDFSSADPTLLASGSDDGSGVSIGTIRTKANVCCVQFPLDSGRSIAFGSADHKIYYYDLRNAKVPLCTLVGHNKTVSYVKFVDSTNIVSASTDNSLKLWDLSACTSRVIDTPVHSFTGHVNVKNFVGLSVFDGYIATGSETNEVFIYHKAFPMPALQFQFNNFDPHSGNEMDKTNQFISSVCWRGQSNTLVAANSAGNIKLLEMV
ncbi:hypothetical protein F8388_006601 [Cannabis sativa]|uniref:Protein kinase domain-containing protein n=1 Tax=Cannabis sativa TaxID=3483 RepID=A0A7J6GUM7_CANSA|nr:hypothetical protein F8388_006601 [Cannabis sativa]KAF4392940.1 hypothetical protein G4B88_011935 [Cannabis sativa]